MMRTLYLIELIIFSIVTLVSLTVKKEPLKSILNALFKTCLCINPWFCLFGLYGQN